ncbi:hypothetical protein K449DRAFT_431116 [Hypoxylon sp. EC38]|nr:hypothetical protein K449DRAFT_431116 [Hypoxylon sp. EC38]
MSVIMLRAIGGRVVASLPLGLLALPDVLNKQLVTLEMGWLCCANSAFREDVLPAYRVIDRSEPPATAWIILGPVIYKSESSETSSARQQVHAAFLGVVD